VASIFPDLTALVAGFRENDRLTIYCNNMLCNMMRFIQDRQISAGNFFRSRAISFAGRANISARRP
jgi:hypothetical protein